VAGTRSYGGVDREEVMARFVIELHRTTTGDVEGVVVPEGTDESWRFSGWLELLRLLELVERSLEAGQD
jgi:hypothetical protein